MKRKGGPQVTLAPGEDARDYALLGLEVLGHGTYGLVARASVHRAADGAHPLSAAVKWLTVAPHALPLPHTVENMTQSEAVDEVALACMLSQLDAPAFPAFYGARHIQPSPALTQHLVQCLRSTTASALLTPTGRQRVAPPERDTNHGPVTQLLLVSELGTAGPLGPHIYEAAHHARHWTPEGVAACVFQLVWSAAVGEVKVGWQHRDINLSNTVLAHVPAPTWQHYTLMAGPVSAYEQWCIRLPAGAVRPLFVDYGMSTYYAVPEPVDPEDAPHASWANIALHAAPELYLDQVRTEAADLWQLGLLAFTLLGVPVLAQLAVPTAEVPAPPADATRRFPAPRARPSDATSDSSSSSDSAAASPVKARSEGRSHPGDLVDALVKWDPRVQGIMTRFVALCRTELPMAAARDGLDAWEQWEQRIARSSDTGDQCARFLLIMALQDALGQPWPMPMDASDPRAGASVWARLLQRPAIVSFWTTQARTVLVPRYVRVLALVDAQGCDFVRRALAWSPEERLRFGDTAGPPGAPTTGCWRALRHPWFAAHFAAGRLADQPPGAPETVHVRYQCHVGPALRQHVPLMDAKLRRYLEAQQARATRVVNQRPAPMDGPGFEAFVAHALVTDYNTHHGLAAVAVDA